MTGALAAIASYPVTAGSSGGSGSGVTISPTAATGTIPGAGLITTNAVTATSVGTSPFTYLWSRTFGDTGFVATSPTAATTTFSDTVDNGGSANATFSVAVTDATSTVRTGTVTAFVRSTSTV